MGPEQQISNPNSKPDAHHTDVDAGRLRLDAYEPQAQRTPAAASAEVGEHEIVRQWARTEMEGTNKQLGSAIAQMDQLNEAMQKGTIKPGSPEYQKALETAVQSYVQFFNSGGEAGIHQQLTAADSIMRQLNLAVENGYIQVDSKPYQVLRDAAVNTYASAISHAQKDLSDPNIVNGLKAEKARVDAEGNLLQAAISGQHQLSPQELQQLGLTSSDPAALKAALQQRVQDDLTLDDMARSLGITQANLGLALMRSAADLQGQAKDQRVALAIQELQKAQAADPQTSSDASFKKHLAEVENAAGVDASKVSLPTRPADVAPGTAQAAYPDANTPPKLPTGDVRVYGPDGKLSQSFHDPFALMELAEQTNPPAIDKLQLAVAAADKIDRDSLGKDMQATKDYIDKALQGSNGQQLQTLLKQETDDDQQIKGLYGKLAQAESQLLSGQGNQPNARQFAAYIQELLKAKSSSDLLQIENNPQSAGMKNALQASDLGRQILGTPGGPPGLIDSIMKLKDDQLKADQSINSLDPNFKQAFDRFNFDVREYASPITTRKELLTALVTDVAKNTSLSDDQRNKEGTDAVHLAQQMVQMNPGMVNPSNPNYAGFKNLLAQIKLTPEQVAKSVGVMSDVPQGPQSPQAPGSSNLPDEATRMLATAGGDPAKQTPAQKAAILLDSIQRAGGQMTQEQNTQFQQLMKDAQDWTNKYGPNLEKYRQQLQSESTTLAANLKADKTYGPPMGPPPNGLNIQGNTVEQIVKELNTVRLAEGQKLQQAGKLDSVNSLLGQIAKATDQTQTQNLNSSLQKLMQSDPDVGRYVAAANLLQGILSEPTIQAYEKKMQNFYIAYNNLDLVKGMYGEALLWSGDAKDAAPLVTDAFNHIPDMMPSLKEAEDKINQQLGTGQTPPAVTPTALEQPGAPQGNSTLVTPSAAEAAPQNPLVIPAADQTHPAAPATPAPPPAAAPATAPAAVDADLPPGVIPGVTDQSAPAAPTVPGMPQGMDAQSQQIVQQIPGFANLQKALEVMQAPNGDPVEKLKQAESDFNQAVNSSTAPSAQQQQDFHQTVTQLLAAKQAIDAAKQLTDAGKPDPNSSATQQAMSQLPTLAARAQALATSLSEPTNARLMYATALSDAAVALYKKANSGSGNAADLKNQADAMTAKAVELLKQIGQVDPTYGYLMFADHPPASDQDRDNLINKAKLTIDGAISLVQAHQPMSASSALTQGLALRAGSVVDDGLTPLGAGYAQPLWTMKNLIGSIPGMPAVSTAGNLALGWNPVTALGLAPFNFITQPTMDDSHVQQAVNDVSNAKLQELKDPSHPDTVEKAIQQHKDSLLDKAVHFGIDMLSGPGVMSLVSRLPMPWYVRAPLALAADAAATYGLDKASHKVLGTSELSGTQLGWHIAGSYGSGLVIGAGNLFRTNLESAVTKNLSTAISRTYAGDVEGASLADTLRIANQKAAASEFRLFHPSTWISGTRNGLAYLDPRNVLKGTTLRPFTLTKMEPEMGSWEGVPYTRPDYSIAERLPDINARMFWGRVGPAALTGGGVWGVDSIADVNPSERKPDGSYYTVGDTLANMGTQFGIGTAATASTLGFFGLSGYAFNRMAGSSAGQWLARTGPGQGIAKITSGVGDLFKPAGRFIAPPNGDVPPVESYTPSAKSSLRDLGSRLLSPEVPKPIEPATSPAWRRFAEGTINNTSKFQTTPLLMPLSMVGSDLYGYHIWNYIDDQSNEQVRDYLVRQGAAAMQAMQDAQQQRARQPGAGQ